MKIYLRRLLITLAFLACVHSASAQNTVFTYQGRVTDNGTNFTGAGQFQFALVTSTNTSRTATATANAPSGGYITGYTVTSGGNGYVTAPAVTVSGGGGSGAAATATISGGVVTGISVSNPGNGSYTSAPTVKIAPPPANILYTTYWSNDGTSSAGSEPTATVNVPVTNGLFTVVLGDTTIANMAAISASLFNQPNLQLRIWFNDGVNGFAALSPVQNLTPAPYATYATTAGGFIAGSGLTIQNNTNGSPNIVGGAANNYVSSGVMGATISGGGATNSTFPMYINSNFGTVGGGSANQINNLSDYSTIGGGYQNFIYSNSPYSTISGGSQNRIQTNSIYSTVGGGWANTASGGFSTIPGGIGNSALGQGSFAAGIYANALHAGAFVWSDGNEGTFSSTANNQFLVHALGGVGINMNNPNGAALYVQGYRSGGTFSSAVGVFENTSTDTGSTGSGPALRVVCDGGSTPAGALSVSANGTGPIAEFGNGLGFVASIQNDGTILGKNFTATSDRNAKQNFTALDCKDVLAKVTAMPVTQWNYKDDAADKKHIGPMAQDFHAAFDLNGADDKHISVVDEGGVALAAIQGLNQKVEEKNVEIQKLKQQNGLLVERLDELEAAVKIISQKK